MSRIELQEHGIYERRDSLIEGPMARQHDDAYPFTRIQCGLWWNVRGECRSFAGADLIREIVVGEGWLPWNGGVRGPQIEEGQHVDIIFRNGERNALPLPPTSPRWTWWPDGKMRDIVAYRAVPPAIEDDEDDVVDIVAVGSAPAPDLATDPLAAFTDEFARQDDTPAMVPLRWRGLLIPPDVYEQVKLVEAELATAKEDLAVAQACAKQKQTFGADLHRDARRWRDVAAILREALA